MSCSEVHEVRKHDQDEDQQGDDGQQGIEGDGPGQEQALVLPEAAQNPQEESGEPAECRKCLVNLYHRTT